MFLGKLQRASATWYSATIEVRTRLKGAYQGPCTVVYLDEEIEDMVEVLNAHHVFLRT